MKLKMFDRFIANSMKHYESPLFKFQDQEVKVRRIAYFKRTLFKRENNMEMVYKTSTGHESYYLTRSMKDLEKEFDVFYRCHRDYFVNLGHVIAVFPEHGLIRVSTGELIKLSRFKAKEFSQKHEIYREWLMDIENGPFRQRKKSRSTA